MSFNARFCKEVGIACVALLLVGWGGAWLQTDSAAEMADSREGTTSGSGRSGFSGLRKLSAGLVWVGAYGDWRRRDEAAMREAMEWTVRIDPDTLVYWLDGARMIAYDVPTWGPDEPALRQRQLRAAIAWLDRARAVHPEAFQLPLEQAVLWWSVARDAEQAQLALAAALNCPDPPYFVARVRAEMLVRLARCDEALALLRSELPRLSSEDPMAMRSVVEQRIRELENRAKQSE